MQEEKCRFAAKAMAELMRPNVPADSPIDAVCELSLIQVFGLGFLMVTAGGNCLNPEARAKAVEPPFLSIAFNHNGDLTILEEYFYSIVVASHSDPDALLSRFEATCKEVRSKVRLRALLRDAVKSIKSAEKAGRPSKITPDDWPELLRLSQHLFPLCVALATVHRSAKKRSLQDRLEFLLLDYPEQVPFLVEHLTKAEAVLGEKTLLANFKTAKTRARKLADIFAGFKFDMSPQYAMQQAQVARRNNRTVTDSPAS